MTTIKNDDFKVIEKKEPAKKRINNDIEDYSYETEREAISVDERAEAIDNAITTLQRNADAQKQLISSVNDKNQTLQDKLTFINDANCTIMFPNHLIESIINKQIEKVNNKLMDSIDEANDTLAEFGKVDMIEKLDNVDLIDKMTNRVDDLEDTINNNSLDDLEYEIESEVERQLGNCYYVEESEVESMIDDRLDGLVTRDDIDNDLKIYGREINELRNRLNNTIYNKICRLFKGMFSYNLSNKVRSIFKRNKKKAVIETKWSSSFKDRIANRMKASKK